MKSIRFVFFIILCSICTSNAKAQTLIIYDYFDTLLGPVNLSGTTVYASPGGAVKRFYIKNISLDSFNFRIERVKIDETEGVYDFFACGSTEGTAIAYPYGLVSANDPFISTDTFNLGFDEDAYLGSHYIPGDSEGCSQYRYYVVTDSSERIDSVDVRYCSVSSVAEHELEFSIYPNPTNNRITLTQLNVVQGAQAVITDLSGKIVFIKELPNLEKLDLDVSFLDNGIYTFMLIKPDEIEPLYCTKLVLQ